MNTLRIIVVTGMPGAGKSEVAQAFRDLGIPVIVMGDVVREETRKRGLDINPENTRKIMLELRERDGLGAIAKRCLDSFQCLESDVIVIEGCRSIAEIDVFDDYADDVTIICVHSSPKVRYARLRDRNRPDAPPTWENFRERDIREISVGLGGVIALSDIMLINEGTLESLRIMSKELATRMA
jgi:dephospho-CoA kinase